MKQDSLKMFCFLLKLVLLLQLTDSINQCKLGANAATQSEVYERMSKIEANNRLQAKEISILKTISVEDRNEIQQLKGRLAKLEAFTFTNNTNDQEILERQKRPARLLPLQLLRGTFKNETEEEVSSMKKFYGPPTSCRDLVALGYTLNGYYLVKGINNNSNKTEIRTVYCKFKQPQGNYIGENQLNYETKVGVVDVKTSSVHFFVSRHGEFSNNNGKIIKFVVQVLNEGNGFDWDNQWFRAPYPGTYFFSISGSKDYHSSGRVSVCVRLNGKDIIGEALSSSSTYYGSFSYQFSFKLNANDKIDLELNAGTVFFIHFTGWMVEQDLLI